MPPSDAVQIPTVLVAFAVTEGNPIQISTGKGTSVPPPATEVMAPAMNEAANATNKETDGGDKERRYCSPLEIPEYGRRRGGLHQNRCEGDSHPPTDRQDPKPRRREEQGVGSERRGHHQIRKDHGASRPSKFPGKVCAIHEIGEYQVATHDAADRSGNAHENECPERHRAAVNPFLDLPGTDCGDD